MWPGEHIKLVKDKPSGTLKILEYILVAEFQNKFEVKLTDSLQGVW